MIPAGFCTSLHHRLLEARNTLCDPENSRTLKIICLKYNTVRSLAHGVAQLTVNKIPNSESFYYMYWHFLLCRSCCLYNVQNSKASGPDGNQAILILTGSITCYSLAAFPPDGNELMLHPFTRKTLVSSLKIADRKF